MIVIPQDRMKALVAHCEAAYPLEACGLLIGMADRQGGIRIDRVAPARNVHAEPRHRFEIDPALHFEWQRKLRGTPRAVLGHYHSHPDGAARPSPHDRAMAADPDLVWLVAAVHGGRCRRVTAHRPADDGFEETVLHVQTTEPREART